MAKDCVPPTPLPEFSPGLIKRAVRTPADPSIYEGPTDLVYSPSNCFLVVSGITAFCVALNMASAATYHKNTQDKYPMLDFEILTVDEFVSRLSEQKFDAGFDQGLIYNEGDTNEPK